MATMKAVYIRQHGRAADLKVSEIPIPEVGSGQVLVRVEAAGINPSDIVSVEGRFAGSVLPRVVGRDFAGTVIQGRSDWIGAKVFGTGGDLGITRDGTHAEYLALSEQAVARRPKSLSTEEAAAVGVPFVTAYSALVHLGRLREGQWVIVSGAAGSVGQAAIQLTHALGGRVIALVKDASQRGSPGIDRVEAIAQSDQGDLEAVAHQATGGKGADLALNGVGSSVFGSMISALGVGGGQVVYSAAGGREFPLDLLTFYKKGLSLFGLDTQKLDAVQCAGILNEIALLFESGTVIPPRIAEGFPLSQAAQAYGRVSAGGTGKVVLLMNE